VKLGFLTACMPRRSLAEVCAWAQSNGFEALEVAAWPDLGDRPFTATHLVADGFGAGDAESIRQLFADHDLICSSLAYYDNNLHPDPDTRAAVNDHVRKCIDAASFSVAAVSAFVGQDPPIGGRQPPGAGPSLAARHAQAGGRLIIETA
jgi:sugar phosphate isomerase/epimerase